MIDKRRITNLLADKPLLSAMIPRGMNYQIQCGHILKKNALWYFIVMGLSENLTNSRKRAKKFGWKCDLDLTYLVELWIAQSGKCALTGQILDYESGTLNNKNPYRTSVDRIDNSQGYIKGNVRLLTHWANNAKSTWPDNVFETFVKKSKKILRESI